MNILDRQTLLSKKVINMRVCVCVCVCVCDSVYRVREAVRYHVCRILYRDTAPGLFVWLERRKGPGRKARKPTESCREFLLGLQPDYPGAEAVLRSLAEDLDRHYFGGGSRLSKREIRAMRKTLRKSPGKPREMTKNIGK